jgi:hypothetical protein
MHDSLTLRVFQWKGSLHAVIDRTALATGRRYSPRTRLWEWSGVVDFDVDERDALLWGMLAALETYDLAPDRAAEGGAREPLGAVGGSCDTPTEIHRHAASAAYNQEAATPPNGTAAPQASPDRLTPKGYTPPLF